MVIGLSVEPVTQVCRAAREGAGRPSSRPSIAITSPLFGSYTTTTPRGDPHSSMARSSSSRAMRETTASVTAIGAEVAVGVAVVVAGVVAGPAAQARADAATTRVRQARTGIMTVTMGDATPSSTIASISVPERSARLVPRPR